MFTLTIETRNAAFEDDQTYELARILRGIASDIEGDGSAIGSSRYRVYDINGYTVGHWTLDPREDD